MLLRREAKLMGAGVFFFFELNYYSNDKDMRKAEPSDNLEIWWAVQLNAHDERYGYNLEAGGHRTTASRFRDRERKLLKSHNCNYDLLPGVDLWDPINPALLASWVPGG